MDTHRVTHSTAVLRPFVGPWQLLQFRSATGSQQDNLDWGGDHRKASPTRRTAETENEHTGLDAWSGVRTQDPSSYTLDIASAEVAREEKAKLPMGLLLVR
jgi:hypothetical protein